MAVTPSSRESLHYKLVEILGTENESKKRVYFQPPESIKIEYPAIIYSRSRIENLHASNSIYKQDRAYEIIVIDSNPDSPVVGKMSIVNNIKHDRHYTKNNLNYDVFTLYYDKPLK